MSPEDGILGSGEGQGGISWWDRTQDKRLILLLTFNSVVDKAINNPVTSSVHQPSRRTSLSMLAVVSANSFLSPLPCTLVWSNCVRQSRPDPVMTLTSTTLCSLFCQLTRLQLRFLDRWALKDLTLRAHSLKHLLQFFPTPWRRDKTRSAHAATLKCIRVSGYSRQSALDRLLDIFTGVQEKRRRPSKVSPESLG